LIQLQQCEGERKERQIRHVSTQQQFAQAAQSLNEARAAQQTVTEHQTDYKRYNEAETTLTHLRRDERQRSILRQRHAQLDNTLATTRATLQFTQQHLDEVTLAHQRILELLPAV
ncbi:MAG: hypothetical protein ACRDHW_12705, partial [Ktedonobacteraceae bacterium]